MTASPPSGSPPSPALNGSRRRGDFAAGLAQLSDANGQRSAAPEPAEAPPTREAVLVEIRAAIQFHLEGLASEGQVAPASSSSVGMVSV